MLDRPESAVQWARVFIYPALRNTIRAVDATAGNGHDTLFIADSAGPGSIVYSIDIQESALRNTERLLEQNGLKNSVKLILGGHQNLESVVGGRLDAVMFNLGYLPGGDRSIITKPDSTTEGILAALKMLKPGGRLSVVAYTGHPGAKDEAAAVGELMEGLDLSRFSVQKIIFWNSHGDSPELYFVTRVGDVHD